jgi:hypothetical protein
MRRRRERRGVGGFLQKLRRESMAGFPFTFIYVYVEFIPDKLVLKIKKTY